MSEQYIPQLCGRNVSGRLSHWQEASTSEAEHTREKHQREPDHTGIHEESGFYSEWDETTTELYEVS